MKIAFLSIFCIVILAGAANKVSVPVRFSPNTIIRSADINQNNDTISSKFNQSIDTMNKVVPRWKNFSNHDSTFRWMNIDTLPSADTVYVKNLKVDKVDSLNIVGNATISGTLTAAVLKAKIGTTSNLPIITTTSGLLSAGAFGTGSNTFCQGNDSRLYDARYPIENFTNIYTPTLTGGTVTQTSCNYKKIGTLVTLFVSIVFQNTGSAVTITLPTPCSSTAVFYNTASYMVDAVWVTGCFSLPYGSSTVLVLSPNMNPTVTWPALSKSYTIYGEITYIAAST